MITHRNKFGLTHCGHAFNKHRIKENGQTYWYCKRQKDIKCKVKAYTQEMRGRQMVKIIGKHNHHVIDK